MSWRQVVGALAVVLAVAAFVAGILGIWTEDSRWGLTAMVVGFAAVLMTLGATYPGDDL